MKNGQLFILTACLLDLLVFIILLVCFLYRHALYYLWGKSDFAKLVKLSSRACVEVDK